MLRYPRPISASAVRCIPLLLCLPLLSGSRCVYEGRPVGAEPDTSFVTESQFLYVLRDDGIFRISLDGASVEPRLADSVGVQDLVVREDGDEVWALVSNSLEARVLLVGAEVRLIPDLDGSLRQTVLPDDGRLAAAASYPDDREGPVLKRPAFDDAIYVVDVDTGEPRMLPPARTSESVADLAFDRDATRISIESTTSETEWMSVADGTRAPALRRERPAMRRAPSDRHSPECAHTGALLSTGNEGIFVTPRGDRTTQDRAVRGPQGGGIPSPFFSDSCAYVVFTLKQDVWVAEVETTRLGRLSAGHRAIPLPLR
jgi:hypothetical protein